MLRDVAAPARPASTRSRPTSASGSATCASTTSSSRTPASGSTSSSSDSSKQVLDQFVSGMSDAIRSMTPEDLAANREMVRDLNELIRERIGGARPRRRASSSPKHGRFFPGAQTFDDIIDQLAQRMAAMQSLMRSMSPEQRAELQSMMEALLRDDRLLVDLAQLASNLDLLLPGGLGDRVRFSGDEPLGLDGALAQIARLQAMERLEDPLWTSRRRATSPPSTATRSATCSATTRSAISMRSTTSPERLEEAGYLTRDGDRLELTPRGRGGSARRSSTTCSPALQRDAFGGHRIDRAGRGGEREETTKPYEFGDPFHLDLRGHAARTRCCARRTAGRVAAAGR